MRSVFLRLFICSLTRINKLTASFLLPPVFYVLPLLVVSVLLPRVSVFLLLLSVVAPSPSPPDVQTMSKHITCRTHNTCSSLLPLQHTTLPLAQVIRFHRQFTCTFQMNKQSYNRLLPFRFRSRKWTIYHFRRFLFSAEIRLISLLVFGWQ